MNIDVDSLFFPAQAIKSEKSFFAGRKTLLQDAVKAVNTPGVSVVLYGERGIGKTSAAWQLYDLLQGDKTLYKLWNTKPIELRYKFKCVWVKCREYMSSTEDILLKLLMPSSERSTFYDVFPNVFNNDRFLESIKLKFKIDLKVVGAEVENFEKAKDNFYEQAKTLLDKKVAIHSIFEEVLLEIKRQDPESEVIIFVDEIDRIQEKKGLGSLIKDTDHAKFVFIGIAESLNSLIADHKSIARKLGTSAFNMDGLTESDIRWIFTKVQHMFPNKIIFTEEFILQVIEKSGGYPYPVQIFGHLGLTHALETTLNPPYKVTKDHFGFIVKKFLSFQEGYEEYSNLLNILNGDSTFKREVLHIIASSPYKWTPFNYIKDGLSSRGLRRFFDTNINNLVEKDTILKYKQDDKQQVRFTDPIARIISMLHKQEAG
ncbi:ATP-binding protein [Spirosoma sordidisoli]|uniref:ATP-binding protein n=1 Tax=Spirosoma sordidisoli TaxID=2502893 RepID=A0A4Q2UJK4_9BACT|nr:ATP-binding protein [Spirosoma sordidisoli]RYC66939.1 ATP-binding protein [Spirosoma sordidisoli]